MSYCIVFPAGDKNRLSIVAIERCNAHEVDDYVCASRHRFFDRQEVVAYAQDLADKHNLPLSSVDPDIKQLLDTQDTQDNPFLD